MDYREAFGVLSRQVGEIEAIDAHTHINSWHMAARGPHGVMLYHMAISGLHAKSILVRTELARALARRVERGQYVLDEAVQIATKLLREAPEHLLQLSLSDP